MFRPEQIPDEVIEVAAKAVYETERPDIETCPWEDIGEWRQNYFHNVALAAICAALNAWLDMESKGKYTVVTLPLKDE